jgi:two-component system sensor histidine kinase PilS (NtrC family)
LIAVEEKKVGKRLVFLNSLRIAILGALILVTIIIFLFFNIPFSVYPIIFSLLFAILLSILYFPLSRRMGLKSFVYLQLSIDILVITLLVYFSGGIVSPFYFLYILPIVVSGIFLSRRDTVYIATLCFITFGILSDLLYLKVVPFFPGIEVGPISLGRFIYNLLMGFIAFASVAMFSSYYFEKIRLAGEELKSIQENLQDMIILNSSVMEKMEDGLVTVDPRGRVVSYNAKAASMLHINLSSNMFQLLLRRGDHEEIEKISQTNNRYYYERKFQNLELGVSVSMIEKVSGFDRLYVFLLTDLTETKSIEKKLKEKENLALIGGMLAGIAHEIRNPLASISGSIQFLKRELNVGPEYMNLMNIVVKESDRLSRTIDEILNISKTSPHKPSRVDLSQILDEIVEMASRRYTGIRFSRKYDPGYEVTADVEKIKQLIWNIMTNAIKAVREKGDVGINVYQLEGTVYMSIRDNGIGMDSEELAKLFTPFHSRFTSGVGLGMFLMKRIVDEHGFKMEIKSEKNRGTEVTVCFKNQ